MSYSYDPNRSQCGEVSPLDNKITPTPAGVINLDLELPDLTDLYPTKYGGKQYQPHMFSGPVLVAIFAVVLLVLATVVALSMVGAI